MEYLFGFLFTLVKISIQAFLYTWLVVQLARRYAAHHPTGRVAQATQQFAFRWYSRLLIAGALFAYSCTYWGDHGLCDHARIPLGYGEAIEELNGTMVYFEATVPHEYPTDQPEVARFQVANHALCAQAAEDFYFVYDLASKRSTTFTSAVEYNQYAASKGLPPANQFQTFGKPYNQYWGGWRFWLLA